MLLWLCVARNFLLTTLAILISAGWHLYASANAMPELFRYAPVPAALLPFALGAMAYHLSKIAPTYIKAVNNVRYQICLVVGCLGAFLFNWYQTATIPVNFLNTSYYYINTALAFATVLLINKSRLTGKTGKVDKFLGDLAYPLFLSHFAAGFIASKVLHIDHRGWELFFWAYPIAMAISIAVVKLVDEPISKLRDRIRSETRTVKAERAGEPSFK